jgi:hypothetical protein
MVMEWLGARAPGRLEASRRCKQINRLRAQMLQVNLSYED